MRLDSSDIITTTTTIIISHVYIVPKPGNPNLRCGSILLSLTQTCFNPAHTETPKGPHNTC